MAPDEALREDRRAGAEAGVGAGADALLRQVDGMRLFPWAALVLSLLPPFLLLLAAPFNPDEVEYFRASRWVGEGLVPFRDFWEHHLPLHFVLLAPVAGLARSAAVESLLLLRGAQLPLLIATVLVAARLLSRAGVSRAASLLGLSCFFLAVHRSVVEIRIDVTMNLFLLAGLLALTREDDGGGARPAPLVFGGMLLGLACLASQRAMPAVLVALAASAASDAASANAVSWRRIARRPLAAAAGLAVTALVTLGLASISSALPELFEQCFRLNVLYEKLPSGTVSGPSAVYWLARFLHRPGAVTLIVLGAAGALLGMRQARTRRLSTVVAILAAAQVILLFSIRSPFPYQFQTLFWLLAILAAVTVDALMRIGRRSAVVVASAAALLALVGMTAAVRAVRWPVLAETLAHQDHVLRSIDRLTRPGSVVLEGCGFAVNRRPALETWFLPSLARDLMAAGILESPTVKELESRRVALVVADSRLLSTAMTTKALGAFVARNFFPLERFVWVPSPNARLQPGERTEWTILAGGAYRVVEVPHRLLHPWFESPWSFPFQRAKDGSAFRLDVSKLRPPDSAEVRLLLDGVPLDSGPDGRVVLEAGARLVAENTSGLLRAVLVAPAGHRVFLDAPYPSTYIEPNLEF
ncbi:MAG TPA: hypothetical protein P5164_13335 [Thermoanaerobaculia bacterium]|nr:hypothetical protein [Thermoanaerobaculia bacterium]